VLNYTIVGWDPAQGAAVTAFWDGLDARDALDQAARDGDLTRPRQLIAVFEGTHFECATAHELAGPVGAAPARSGSREWFTVVGFWIATGECFCDTHEAANGVAAMREVGAKIAGRRPDQELQLVCAYPGRHNPVLRRELVPEFW